MANLDRFKTKDRANEGALLQVLDPTTGALLLDEETAEVVSIRLLGADSDVYRQKQWDLAREALRTRKARGVSASVVDMEDAERQMIAMLAELTLEWHHIEWGEGTLPCTKENAVMLYTELPWLREQVAAFVQDRSNYLGNCSRN